MKRWVSGGGIKKGGRPIASRPEPKNKLTKEEKQEILEVIKKEEFADLPPTQIVPKLADQRIYIASESSFYRVLREENMQNHRGRSKRPERRLPESHLATAPNQVWTWDITWLKGPVKGMFYRLYLIIDIFSRKIVGSEVWETEEAKYAEELMKKTIINEKIQGRPLVLNSDNGSPMIAAIFQVLLEKLGIQSSYSRPIVSNDSAARNSEMLSIKIKDVADNKIAPYVFVNGKGRKNRSIPLMEKTMAIYHLYVYVNFIVAITQMIIYSM